MDGENNGKPYEQMDGLGGTTPIFGNTQVLRSFFHPAKPEHVNPLQELEVAKGGMPKEGSELE